MDPGGSPSWAGGFPTGHPEYGDCGVPAGGGGSGCLGAATRLYQEKSGS